MGKFELLSPVGDIESLKLGFLYGADAVYVGGEGFGLRANAGFSMDELAFSVDYAHKLGKKIYLACNIVANNHDVDEFPAFISQAEKLGTDAVIVSDLGMFDLVRTHAPELPVHISTQAGVMNYVSANMLCKLGAKRIILARETSLKNIRRIREETPPELEIEVFVHGAMCMGFSGRCLISAYLANRDANRGACAQPCRWKYYLMEETRPGEFFRVFEEKQERGSYILNSKDLCMIEHIGDLAENGVTSFKIEGRAKTAYYTAVITGAYRVAVDAYEKGMLLPEWVKREVNCVSHRPYCTGFYFDESDIQSYENSGYIRDCDFVGVIDGFCNDMLEITQRNYFTADDRLEVVVPGRIPAELKIGYMENSKGEAVRIANHAVEKLYIRCKTEFPQGSLIRRVNHR
ncbi:MAG: U32 family peptidase [Oscillospiraceae bacterium]|nr:U32 family peptidase [Oscillospiraceae bacterium]